MVNPLPFRGTPSRRVHFADEQSETQTETRSAVQDSADADVEQASSSEPQQVQTLQVPRLVATDSLVELRAPVTSTVSSLGGHPTG